jgi:hypothetical protein
VEILAFFVFVVTVTIATWAIGFGLSLLTERTVSRRCRMPHEMYRRRIVRRQRERCRDEA